MSISWMGKATVQATQSGVFLAQAKLIKYEELINFGQQLMTTAILAIIMCAPMGAILMNTCGKKLLTKSENEPIPLT